VHEVQGGGGSMSTRYTSAGDVPTQVIIDRLWELSRVIIDRPVGWELQFTMRIPAELDRDADLVLAEAAIRLSKLTLGEVGGR